MGPVLAAAWILGTCCWVGRKKRTPLIQTGVCIVDCCVYNDQKDRYISRLKAGTQPTGLASSATAEFILQKIVESLVGFDSCLLRIKSFSLLIYNNEMDYYTEKRSFQISSILLSWELLSGWSVEVFFLKSSLSVAGKNPINCFCRYYVSFPFTDI